MADGDQPGPAGLSLYPLRLGLALVFLYTGTEKLVELSANAPIVALTGVPWPELATVTVGVVEILCAVALVLGVMTRTAAMVLSVLMVSILVTLKIPGSFWGDGWGIDVAVLSGTLTLALNGPGRPTISSVLEREEVDPEPRVYGYLHSKLTSDAARGDQDPPA